VSVTVRMATAADAGIIHAFIQELADYEKEPDAVEATPGSLRAQMERARPPFECLLAEHDGAPVGFALFFQTYSTWKGKPGMWLEDLYVTPDSRRHGAGDALLRELATICHERDYGRLELTALDWNDLAKRFYDKRGARAMDEWTRWRFDGEALLRLAQLTSEHVEV